MLSFHGLAPSRYIISACLLLVFSAQAPAQPTRENGKQPNRPNLEHRGKPVRPIDSDLKNANPEANALWHSLEGEFRNRGQAKKSEQATLAGRGQGNKGVNQPTPNVGNGRDDQKKGKGRKQAAIDFADQARQFYNSHPNHPRAMQARKLEILTLIDGDGDPEDSHHEVSQRLAQAALSFSKNPRWAEEDRAEIAGFYGFHRGFKSIAAGKDRTSELRRIARKLVSDFPTQPQGYISMLSIAEQTDQKNALTLISEVTNSAAVTPEIHERATMLRKRVESVGRNLEQLVGRPLFGAGSRRAPRGRSTVLYTWSSRVPASLEMSRALGNRKGRPVQWIGLDLDPFLLDGEGPAPVGISSSRFNVDTSDFPGILVTVESDLGSRLRSSLGLDSPGLLIVTDSAGQIRSVFRVRDFSRPLQGIKL